MTVAGGDAPIGAARIGPLARIDIAGRADFHSSVPVLTFVSYRSGHFYECQNQRDTSNHMILVWL